MKRTLIIAGLLLATGCLVMADTTTADLKWLTAVQIMVENGQTQVTTPSQARVQLAKSWAQKNGYVVEVSTTETSYKLVITQNVAKN